LNPNLQTPQQRPANAISTRLREVRNFGDLEPLIADIRDRGLRHPVTITRDGRLILGARRLAACLAAGTDPVDCWPVYSIAEALAVIRWENEDDLASGDAKHHLPATIATLAAQDMAIRQLDWWPRATASRNPHGRDHRAELTEALCGPGEEIFLNASQYRQLHGLAAAADGWQAGPGGVGRLAIPRAAKRSARAALDLLDHRDTRQVNALYSRWRNGTPLTDPGMKPLAPEDVRPLVSVITGFTSALAATGAAGDLVTDDQVTEIDGALSALLRTGNEYRKTLRRGR
jgi:ParB-like nuclease family protein